MNTYDPNHTPHETQSSTEPTVWEHLGKDVPFVGEDQNPPIIELPTTSANDTCRSLLRYLKRGGHMEEIQSFVESTSSQTYEQFTSVQDFLDSNPSYFKALQESLTFEDQTAIKRYTSFDYKLINQVARGHWNYETLGLQTPERVASAEQTIDQIESAITSAPAPSVNFVAYRGTNLDSFNGYHIDSLSDLQNLNHQFFLETGFTSTSLNPDTSFTDRDFDDPLRNPCNIEIKYLIPKDYHSGVCLASPNLSWNPEQNEFLINRYSLSYISSVEVDTKNNRASLEMTLIPNAVYDHPPENS